MKGEFEKAKLNSVPEKTRQGTAYCICVWDEWCKHRLQECGKQILPPDKLQSSELAKHTSSFIFEVRKRNGKEFSPNSLHHLVYGLERHLRFNVKKANIDIFSDDAFADFKLSLDVEMKRLKGEGLGSMARKQSHSQKKMKRFSGKDIYLADSHYKLC